MSAVLKVEKPWGHEVRWAINNKYLGKILHINRSQKLSRQYHEVKDETIYVLQGILILELGMDESKNGQAEKIKVLETGESYRIKPGVIHRFCAPNEGHVRLIEVSTPEIDDVVRLHDEYGRDTKK
jgi:mannose-6-phosphate isomerase-like protein (cupin superfamily)|tara:strand:- start:1559 stop:1936 length:378 start_codon:yes stop_codon:yes gene_type:complete